MALTWGERKRAMVIATFVAILLILVSGVLIVSLYRVPSCSDGVQNQDEAGVDCGGSCAYLCAHQVVEPRVVLSRAVQNAQGRVDYVAYIENRNQTAGARDAQYTVEVHDTTGALLASREGTISLPPKSIVPLYISGITTAPGAQQAFVSFPNGIRWHAADPTESPISVAKKEVITDERTRVVVTLENRSARPVADMRVVAVLKRTDGTVAAVSQTIARSVPAFGTAEIVFTWNEIFFGGTIVPDPEITIAPVLP